MAEDSSMVNKEDANLVVQEKVKDAYPKTKVDAIAWWIDSGAITHVCKDRCWFKTYKLVEDGSVLYMGDDHFAPVHWKKECSTGIGQRGCASLRGQGAEPFAGLIVLALAAIHNLVIHQMDVKIAFLNDNLEEEVYMKQPEGFIMPDNEHKVCKLVKSLYGLKQAPKQLHQKFDEVVLSSGFLLNQSVKCVYSKFDSSGKGVIICLYVDDMLIFGTDQNQVDKTKKFLSLRFSIKDMGEADAILGIMIKCENKEIVITQSHYIEKILKKFNREDCSPVSTPMDPVKKLKPNTSKPVDQLEYSRAIGCLMYAMTSTRPDIAYAVGRLSRFTSNHSREHWQAITRVFKYLKGTMNYGLSYVGYPSVLEAYSDTSWINHVEDLSSTSG
ncbi:zinc finger, CCHC-type containing protein [Tanacetum coccineum]